MASIPTNCSTGVSSTRTAAFRQSVLPTSPVQWLSDIGSAHTAEQTRGFARQIGLLPLTTPVCSPQSNGMAESFVKTMKRDYIRHMPKPDRATALRNLAIAFEHYNEEIRTARGTAAHLGSSGVWLRHQLNGVPVSGLIGASPPRHPRRGVDKTYQRKLYLDRGGQRVNPLEKSFYFFMEMLGRIWRMYFAISAHCIR